MRYGNEMFFPTSIISAMGDEWKQAVASQAFSALVRNPEWDGQPVSFRFFLISEIEDGEELGIRVQSYFDSEEKNAGLSI